MRQYRPRELRVRIGMDGRLYLSPGFFAQEVVACTESFLRSDFGWAGAYNGESFIVFTENRENITYEWYECDPQKRGVHWFRRKVRIPDHMHEQMKKGYWG